MRKLFISQPMRGKTDEEILKERELAVKEISEHLSEEFELIDSFIEETPKVKNTPLWYLAKSLELMSNADFVYFAKGFEKNRGCKIEYMAAINYGISRLNHEKVIMEKISKEINNGKR